MKKETSQATAPTLFEYLKDLPSLRATEVSVLSTVCLMFEDAHRTNNSLTVHRFDLYPLASKKAGGKNPRPQEAESALGSIKAWD